MLLEAQPCSDRDSWIPKSPWAASLVKIVRFRFNEIYRLKKMRILIAGDL